MTQKTLVQIFDNTIKYWNDSRIASTNPTIILPGEPIHRIVRSGSSGTTNTLTESLSKFDPSWTIISSNPTWPNENTDKYFQKISSSKLSTTVRALDYSISYLQDEVGSCSILEFSVQLQNADGNFVLANSTTTQAAIEVAGLSFTSRFVADFVNPTGSLSYPINSVTYFIYRSKSNSTSCSKEIGLYFFAKMYLFAIQGNSIVQSSLRFPLAATSVNSKIKTVLDQMECSGTLIKDYFKPTDYNPIIIGSVLGFFGGVTCILFTLFIILVIIIFIFLVKSSLQKQYYENLIT